MNYILKLITLISDKNQDLELKQNLLKYSASLVYKINVFVQNQLKIVNDQNKTIKNLMKYNLEMKDDIKNKINQILLKIDHNDNNYKTSKYSEF